MIGCITTTSTTTTTTTTKTTTTTTTTATTTTTTTIDFLVIRETLTRQLQIRVFLLWGWR